MATLVRFAEVFQEERTTINGRLDRDGRPIELEIEDIKPTGEPIFRPTPESNVIGVSLSGGGVRSSAFCLGALQALESVNALKQVDYLSTVSGGGYIGTALCASTSVSRQSVFPFYSAFRQIEPAGLQHIRDHSNYLFPRGFMNVFYNVVIYLRGLLANWVTILPFLLIPAALTIWIKPDFNSLSKATFAGTTLPLIVDVSYFAITLTLVILLTGYLILWGYWRSLMFTDHLSELTGWARKVAGIFLALILFAAFCEIQPIVLRGMFELDNNNQETAAQMTGVIKYVASGLAAFSVAIGFMSQYIAGFIKSGAASPTWRARTSRAVAKAFFFLAAAAVPLILWLMYIYLSYWGMKGQSGNYNAPSWIGSAASFMHDATPPFYLPATPLWLYLYVSFILFVISVGLSPNSNSLHRLYRDRLSKAFLFNPDFRENGSPAYSAETFEAAGEGLITRNRFDLQPIDRLKLGEVSHQKGPYQLINTAINLRGSKYANRRGRDADFFLFSSKYVGSEATQYISTTAMEELVPELDLATAMAVSGAAASSNMGSKTVNILSPTLALLNIRLGFWLVNPIWIATRRTRSRLAKLFDQFYMVNEMFGWLKEDSGVVYLSDGGHIENLGIYELLRRRCRLIIAIDSEADPAMNFISLADLQRYARIDLGVRIDLPWAEIRKTSLAMNGAIAGGNGQAAGAGNLNGPHCAIGRIEYPMDGMGILLYVKASLTGDESDYILDYKRRYPDFPHETTADQFFTEEQFEVYRALGFHALQGVFEHRDKVADRPGPSVWSDVAGANSEIVRELRSILNY